MNEHQMVVIKITFFRRIEYLKDIMVKLNVNQSFVKLLRVDFLKGQAWYHHIYYRLTLMKLQYEVVL